MKQFYSAVVAGFLIGMSCTVYQLANTNYEGAFLFCLGLTVICTYDLDLFTGRVGYVKTSQEDARLGVIWVGNLLGAVLCAAVMNSLSPDMSHLSEVSMLSRLNQPTHKTVILSMLCGALMFLAVDLYKLNRARHVFPYTSILLCVPAFLMCGFEHSVADMFYLSASGMLRTAPMHLLLVSLGNAVGAIVTRQVLRVTRGS